MPLNREYKTGDGQAKCCELNSPEPRHFEPFYSLRWCERLCLVEGFTKRLLKYDDVETSLRTNLGEMRCETVRYLIHLGDEANEIGLGYAFRILLYVHKDGPPLTTHEKEIVKTRIYGTGSSRLRLVNFSCCFGDRHLLLNLYDSHKDVEANEYRGDPQLMKDVRDDIRSTLGMFMPYWFELAWMYQ